MRAWIIMSRTLQSKNRHNWLTPQSNVKALLSTAASCSSRELWIQEDPQIVHWLGQHHPIEPKMEDSCNQEIQNPWATQTCLGVTEIYSTSHPPCTETEPPCIIQTIWDGDRKPISSTYFLQDICYQIHILNITFNNKTVHLCLELWFNLRGKII